MTLDLNTLETYMESCRKIASTRLAGLSVAEVSVAEDQLNAYPGLKNLESPHNLLFLEDIFDEKMLASARQAILEGRIFWEHAAAGEATRLKLGAKILIEPHKIPAQPEFTVNPGDLAPLTLGERHLGQWMFEIWKLAEEAGLDPQTVLKRQKLLLILNQDAYEPLAKEILARKFFGLKPGHFLFMVQASFPGLIPGANNIGENGNWHYSETSPHRLHNHGQMAMQKTMPQQIFHLTESAAKHFLSQEDYFALLDETEDLVSYNIEDLGYLACALDFQTIGLALDLAAQGYGMTMEIVANNQEAPVKGGMCAFDPQLGRDVVIESFRLDGLEPKNIKMLNKNFNHYLNPGQLFRRLHQEGLFMPITVKEGAVYFQPVQGDLNFLAQTAFISRRTPAPLSSWKSPADTNTALTAMAMQDKQQNFLDFLRLQGVLN